VERIITTRSDGINTPNGLLLPQTFCLCAERHLMRVAFSDESSADSGGPDTIVAAVLTNLDVQWPHVPEEIEALIHSTGKDPQKYEIKGSALLNDIRRALQNPSEKNGHFGNQARQIIAGILGILCKHAIPVFCGVVNKAGWNYLLELAGTCGSSKNECL
jgi:hypothetical protein